MTSPNFSHLVGSVMGLTTTVMAYELRSGNMKGAMIAALMCCFCIGVGMLQGCGKPKPSDIVVIIQDASTAGVSLALREMADPVGAKTAADLILGNVVAARAVMQGQIPTGAILQDLLSTKLLDGLPLELSIAIKLASIALNEYVIIPSDATYLSTNEIMYVNAFLDGIEAAAKTYSGPQVRRGFIRGKKSGVILGT